MNAARRRGRISIMAVALAAVSVTMPRAGQAQAGVYPTDLVDIAAAANGGRIIAASSVFENDQHFKADNLIKGQVYNPTNKNSTFGWESNKYDPLPEGMDYITIGFKDNAVKRIGKIVLDPTSDTIPQRWAKDVEVRVSTDSADGPYRAIAEITLQQVPEPQEFIVLPTEARFVQLAFRTNWGSDRAVSLGHVEIYEAIDTSDPFGLIIKQLEGAINELVQYKKTQTELGSAHANLAELPEAELQPAAALSPATLELVQAEALPPEAPSPISPVNIAAAQNGGRIVDFTSIFISDPKKGPDPAYGPSNLISGQVYDEKGNKGSYGWASEGFEPGKQYVTLGFKGDKIRLISKIVLNPASNQTRLRWARRVEVQVTSDSPKTGPFRTVTTINLRNEAGNQEFTFRPVEAKYVRFVFMANGVGGNDFPNANPDVDSDRAVSLGQIQVYEASPTGQQLDYLISRFSQVLLELKKLHSQAVPQPAADTAADATADQAPPDAPVKAAPDTPVAQAAPVADAAPVAPADHPLIDKPLQHPYDAKDHVLQRHSASQIADNTSSID